MSGKYHTDRGDTTEEVLMAQHCGHIQQLVELGIVGPTVIMTEIIEHFANPFQPLLAESCHETKTACCTGKAQISCMLICSTTSTFHKGSFGGIPL